MSTRQEFVKKVAKIQKELKAPKSQYNKFGGYNYRNQEDILEAVKPLLGDLVLTVTDEIVEVGGRVYVKATSTITDGENELSNTAFARESESKKGMDDSMCTGTASSYSRKYSLNGLFLIDDTKDPDSDEFQKQTGKEDKTKSDKPSRFTRTKKTEKVEEESSNEAEETEVTVESEVEQEEKPTPSKTSFRRFTRGNK